jgi:hypothetical protein
MSWGDIGLGISLVVLGFVLAELGAWWRDSRTNAARERTLLKAAVDEVASVTATATNDRNILQRELQLVAKQQHVVNPLDPIPTGFWEAIRWSPPRRLLDESDALRKARSVARLTQMVNEMISSREAFRVNNLAMSDFYATLKTYDELLDQFLGELIAALNELGPLLVRAAEA